MALLGIRTFKSMKAEHKLVQKVKWKENEMCCIVINITKDVQFTQHSRYWLSNNDCLTLPLRLRALCNINRMISM